MVQNILVEIIRIVLISFLLTIVVEIIARSSVKEALKFLLNNSSMFIYNLSIIVAAMSLSLLTRRRIFVYVLVCIMGIILAIIEYFIIKFRGIPFVGNDILVLKFGISISKEYISLPQFIAIIASIFIVWKAIAKTWTIGVITTIAIPYTISIPIVLLMFIPFVLVTIKAYKSNLMDEEFNNLRDIYDNCGLIYSFYVSVITVGIRPSDNYSEQKIKAIKSDLKESDKNVNDIKPNIIMVQLESFFDPCIISSLTFSKDPIPNFRRYTNEYSSGNLNVYTLGGGTIQTEFEVLTGMATRFFGLGEIPYSTILKKKSCDSVAYNLRGLNYSTHVIHNNEGTFYDRNIIFKNLGFDSFTSIEDMSKVKKNPSGWAKDCILTDEVIKVLDSDEKSKFIYTITVQCHGGYPTKEILDQKEIEITSEVKKREKISLEYYINQLYETDKFIGELINEVSNRKEATVIVFFGDHLSALNFKKYGMENKEMFKAPYFIWDNMNLEKINMDMESFQLQSEILNRINLGTGLLNKYHLKMKDNKDYLRNLKNLQYDILYGKNKPY